MDTEKRERKYIFMPAGLDSLRLGLSATHVKQFRRLLDQCILGKKEVFPDEHPLKSITYYAMGAANNALAFKLTSQKQFLDESRRWLFAGVDYPHWGRAVKVDVDLSAAWLLFGYGLCYDWLKDDLEPDDKKALLDKLILQGGRMYDYAFKTSINAIKEEIANNEQGTAKVMSGRSWATSFWQNHNWIDFAGLAMAGYAVRDEYPEAQAWIDLARENFLKVIPMLADDGSDYEGVVYWRYGVVWLFIYAEVLRETEGVDLFAQSNFLRNTFFYRLYQSAPDLEQIFNHGDCHDRRSGHIPALYYKTAAEYGNGYAQWLADTTIDRFLFREGYQSGVKPGILPEAFLEFLWYDPSVEPKDVRELPTTRYFADLGLLCVRDSWESDALAFSYKCSSGGGHKQWKLSCEIENTESIRTRSTGHHHPDANSFMLIRGSDYLAIDEGYSGAKMAKHHNLIIVDNQGYEGDGTKDVYRPLGHDRTAVVEAFSQQGDCFYIRGESSKLYGTSLELDRLAREIVHTGKGYYIIRDTVSSHKKHTYSWLLHADVEPETIGGITEFRNGDSVMRTYIIGEDIKTSVELMTVSANVTSQEPDNIVYTNLQTLRLENAEPAESFEFLTVVAAGGIYGGTPALDITYEKTLWGAVIQAPGETVIYNGTAETAEYGDLRCAAGWSVFGDDGTVRMRVDE